MKENAVYLFLLINLISSCVKTKNIILTQVPAGHTLHHSGVFSKDGTWIVFDGRNNDTKLGENAQIGIVNVETGEEKVIYETQKPTVFGPGVGAVSFSPDKDFVAFIHGLPDANQEKPYAITRRTGVGIDISRPFEPIMLDARDLSSPYTPGSLRGGSHSHGWSGDGQLLSFTYNDDLIEPDLRMVGLMIPFKDGIKVGQDNGNNDGTMYSAIVSDVVQNPVWGSDEINKAFDECWVGKQGYTNKDNLKVPYAIAFQGNVKNTKGEQITEVFIVDIDLEKILTDEKAVGIEGKRPQVPVGISQKRITFSTKGISDTRHWLRSSPDGKFIYALIKDEKENNQICVINILSGEMYLITNNDFTISFSFNLSHDGSKICFVAENHINILNLKSKKIFRFTNNNLEGEIVGAPSFSPDGKLIVFNQFIKEDSGKKYLQIGRLQVP